MNTYGWVICYPDERDPDHWHRQSRCIVAAKSKAEVARIIGAPRPSRIWNLGQTWNAFECEQANKTPGVVLYRGLDVHPLDTPFLPLPKGVNTW